MEFKRQSLPIIGTDSFALTENDVRQALENARKNAKGFKELLSDPNEGLARTAANMLPGAEQEVETLSASPRSVLNQVKSFYDRAVELGSSGLDETQIAEQLNGEFADLSNFYGVLRKTSWGYRLGQSVIAAGIKRK